jgi:hypothetical protein
MVVEYRSQSSLFFFSRSLFSPCEYTINGRQAGGGGVQRRAGGTDLAIYSVVSRHTSLRLLHVHNFFDLRFVVAKSRISYGLGFRFYT